MKPVFLAVAIAASQLPQGSAPPPTAPASTALPGELVRYLSGEWRGSGQFVRSKKALSSVYSFEAVGGGEALLVRHHENRPNKFAYTGLWSVDVRSGEMTLMIAGNLGGGARLFRSKGWDGRKLTFSVDPILRTSFGFERFTFERTGADQFTVRYEISRDGAEWSGGDFQTFNRAAKRQGIAATRRVN